MKKVKLGSSDLHVSEVCLGSMTWGNQNSQEDANQQLDYAISHGINFVDTAEMYSIPPSPDTCNSTEIIIGNWLAANPDKRQNIVLASKIVGPGFPWIRNGTGINGETVKQALDDSLERLQTDYLDLYQLHWPNRQSPHFGKHWPGDVNNSEVNVSKERDNYLGILQALDEAVKAGKIRYCGLSDDTPWGIKEYLALAREHGLPMMVSIQNEFNLLHLKDSPYLLETCVLDDVAFMPWSPMAGGALSGKYRNGVIPPGSRWSMAQRNGIFRDTTYTSNAIEAYYQIAQKHGLSLAQMSLAWVYQFNGVTSTIIGATTMDNLIENIGAYDIVLSDEILTEIDEVIRTYPVPF